MRVYNVLDTSIPYTNSGMTRRVQDRGKKTIANLEKINKRVAGLGWSEVPGISKACVCVPRTAWLNLKMI